MHHWLLHVLPKFAQFGSREKFAVIARGKSWEMELRLIQNAVASRDSETLIATGFSCEA